VIGDNYFTRQKTTCFYELAGLPRLLPKSSSNLVLGQLNPVSSFMTYSVLLRQIIIFLRFLCQHCDYVTRWTIIELRARHFLFPTAFDPLWDPPSLLSIMHRGLTEAYCVSPYSYWSTLTTAAFEVRACSMMRNAYTR
jgi:hypothetical protein